MLKVGITGGIGSGKSVVARIFEVIGIPVFYADDAAKRLMNEDPALKEQIKAHFGDQSYRDQQLDRAYLASVVFNDPAKLELLNSLVHPATISDADKWMNALNHPYAVKEAALIFESDAHKNLDYVIGVKAPYSLRLQRAMQRDELTREAVEARMNKQMDEDRKMELCDFLVNNDETELLIPQVIALHEKLLEKAAAKKN